MLVLSTTSERLKFGSVSKSSRPFSASMPSRCNTSGRMTSASTSNTDMSISVAMLMARLMPQNVLPSPGNALVTMISESRFAAASLLRAFLSKGRLIWRNSSAWADLACVGTRRPERPSRSRSRVTAAGGSAPLAGRAGRSTGSGTETKSLSSRRIAAAGVNAVAAARRTDSTCSCNSLFDRPAATQGTTTPERVNSSSRLVACSIMLMIGPTKNAASARSTPTTRSATPSGCRKLRRTTRRSRVVCACHRAWRTSKPIPARGDPTTPEAHSTR